MLKEFKNGNLVIDLKNEIKEGYYDIENTQWIDNFYNDELTMSDFYINQINGYMYMTNFRTNLVYDISDIFKTNILIDLRNELIKNDFKMKFYPLTKRHSKFLLEDLENGY